MSTKPAIRITPGSIPAALPGIVNITLFGGHLDGLRIDRVEVPRAWPIVTTLERWAPPGQADDMVSFIPRYYAVCLCSGKVALDRGNRVRYCMIGDER